MDQSGEMHQHHCKERLKISDDTSEAKILPTFVWWGQVCAPHPTIQTPVKFAILGARSSLVIINSISNSVIY